MTRWRTLAGAVAVAAVPLCALAAGCGAGDAGPSAPPRIVDVSVPGNGRVPHVATGVTVGDRRVLTVAHVLAGGRPATVLGRPARVVRIDRRADLALLSVPALRGPALRLADGTGPVSVRVLRDGRPQALPGTIRRRVNARVRDSPGDRPLIRPAIELAAGVAAGDSGAPVLDDNGRVLWIVFARASDGAATAWAVDRVAVRALLVRSG
jgi:S1-C subfamily serine protease